MYKDKELQIINDFRNEINLPMVVTKTRKCLMCEGRFESQGLRLCPKCQKLRIGCACAPDGTAFKCCNQRAITSKGE